MTIAPHRTEQGAAGRGAWPIFLVFLRLGLTSFGGPVAHLGYYRAEFVERRRWLSEAAYADLVALGQFMPGPASSQVGFALGLMRGGWAGGLAAWTAFTLPSAVLLMLFAAGASALTGTFAQGVIAGLKILAVAVVAQAVLGMGRSLCPDRPRMAVMLAAMALLALWSAGGAAAQVGAILLGAAAGVTLGLGSTAPGDDAGEAPGGGPSRRVGAVLIGLAVALLIALPLLALAGIGGQALALVEAFYRAGALVFGGGHVVLPLLEEAVVAPGWVSESQFLAGYGATQAVPGPVFTFAAYLGMVAGPAPNGVAGAVLALGALFLPGLLLMAGALPFWRQLRRNIRARAALAGVNAAVVGVLATALYDPIFVTAIGNAVDMTLAAAAFFALTLWRAPVWAVVLATGLAGGLLGAAGL